MIIVHKGGINLGPLYLDVYVYVELNENDPAEYINGIGTSINTDEIANKAIKDGSCFTNKKMYGIFGEIIKQSVEVYRDDSYDYLTIDDMINNRDTDYYEKWKDTYKTLEEYIASVKYNNKSYPVYIHIFTERKNYF